MNTAKNARTPSLRTDSTLLSLTRDRSVTVHRVPQARTPVHIIERHDATATLYVDHNEHDSYPTLDDALEAATTYL